MGALIKLLAKIFEFAFAKGTAKFLVFAGLYYTVLDFFPEVIGWLETDGAFNRISNALSGLSSGVLYFLAPFNLGFGLKIVFSAYVTRFAIRRIPIIG